MTNKKLILTSCLVLAIALAGCGAKDKKVETPEVAVEQDDSTIKQSELDAAALADTMDSTADIVQESTDTNEAAVENTEETVEETTEEQVETTEEQVETEETTEEQVEEIVTIDAEEYLSDKNIALNKDEMKRLGNGQDFLNTHLKDTTWKLYCEEENNEYEYVSDSSATLIITATSLLPDKAILIFTSDSVGNMEAELGVIADDNNIKIESNGVYMDVESYLDNNGIQWLTLSEDGCTMWFYKDTTDKITE